MKDIRNDQIVVISVPSGSEDLFRVLYCWYEPVERGIMVRDTAVGTAIACNKIQGIRGALCRVCIKPSNPYIKLNLSYV